jgi:hypothetical protein
MAANQHKQKEAKKHYLTMAYIYVHDKILLVYYMNILRATHHPTKQKNPTKE